ncbi:sphingomyelin phosphodiesterase 4-like isoform X2 [Convolutriloba macropyga]|uniref:sphingomyelin phosphodiesterase 4-like isoform X2 n=1 Tax=Convolutriloba macropyga TaxID=536237 RepID=UPI003F524438
MHFPIKNERGPTSSMDEAFKALTLRNSVDRCKYLSEILPCLSESELGDIVPKIIVDFLNPSSDWKLRNARLSRYDDQQMYEFLQPLGVLVTSLLRLEMNGSLSWRIALLKLPEEIALSIANVFTENQDNLYSSFVEPKVIVNEMSVSPVAFYFAAWFGYICHPVNKKNDFWIEPNHWCIRIMNAYLEFFVPRISVPAVETVLTLPKLLTQLASSSNSVLPGYFSRLPASNDEVSLTITKTFTSMFASMLLGSHVTGSHPLSRPSLDHVRIVRCFIRYFHANILESPKDHRRENTSVHLPFGSPNTSRTHCNQFYEEFYSSLTNDVFPIKLYEFISQTIRNWPNEFPFRVIVETWLTYIQPWRVSTADVGHNVDDEIDVTAWYHFIDDNLNFYTQILLLVLPHLLRADLTMTQNSAILFRIGKVFSSNSCELMTIVKDCERKLLSVQTLNRTVINSYCPVITTEFEKDVAYLVKNCLQTVYNMKTRATSADKECNEGSFWTSFWNPIASDENVFDHSLRNPMRLSGGGGSGDRMSVMRQLEESARFWSSMFNLDIRKIHSSILDQNASRKNLNTSLGSDGNNNYPEHKMGELGPELTERGRWQIMTGKRRFNLTYAGDPDLQPVRSFEIAFLVKLALYLSTIINSKWTDELDQLYNREDLIGRFLRSTVICGPLRFSPQKMAPTKCIESKTNEFTFKPHVSLRLIASYSTLFYSFLFVSLCFLILPKWLILGAILIVIAVPVYFLSK